MYLQGSEQCPWMHLHDVGTEAVLVRQIQQPFFFPFFLKVKNNHKIKHRRKNMRNVTGNAILTLITCLL